MSTPTAIVADRSEAVDPVTFEVIRNRLSAINHEQSLALQQVAGSPVVTDANDFNVGLYLPDGQIVAMGLNVLYHAGSMSPVIANTLVDCAENPGIREGDAFICNDPYKGALHPPDVTLVEPIFFEGELVAWTGACCHELDVGGMEPGSWAPTATDVRQEGMLLPPIKLIEGGVLREDLWNGILGMSRLPFVLALDLKAMRAGNTLARERLRQLFERYGLATVRAVMEGLLDRSERQFRERIAAMPDGVFRGRNFLDHDGHSNALYTVEVEVVKRGDTLSFDYSKTSGQAPGFVNCTGDGLRGAVYSAVFPILGSGLAWNHGIARAIEVICPDGLLVNARHPAPVGSATLAGMWLAETVAVEAASRLASTDPERSQEAHATTVGGLSILTAAGVDQYGEPFGTGTTDQLAAGGGAYRHRNGTAYAGMHCIVTQQIPNVESSENFAPMLYLRRSTTPDSGGAGAYRGGVAAGAAMALHGTDALYAVLTSHGVEVPNSIGLFGGNPGSTNHFSIARDSDIRARWAAGEAPVAAADVGGRLEVLPAKPGHIMWGADDVFEWTWQGGGGFGDPLDASATAIARDVAIGAVSVAAARDLYGVVVAADGELDPDATDGVRAELRRSRADPDGVAQVPADATTAGMLSPYLRLVETGDGLVHACACEADLGPAEANFKHACRSELLEIQDVVPNGRLHRELELRRFSCPGCGRAHSVELVRLGQQPLHEAQLDLEDHR